MNIWGTIEADAWSRTFDYEEYVRYCELARLPSKTEAEYTSLCQQFEAEMIEDFLKAENKGELDDY